MRILDVPQATYAGWETGRTTPGAHLFDALAEFLGIAEQDVATLCSTPFVVDTTGWPPFGQFVGRSPPGAPAHPRRARRGARGVRRAPSWPGSSATGCPDPPSCPGSPRRSSVDAASLAARPAAPVRRLHASAS